MTTAGGESPVISWCAACRHAITPVERGWGHVSDDDWAGPDGECPCTWDLTACRPLRRRRIRERRLTREQAVYGDYGNAALARGITDSLKAGGLLRGDGNPPP